MRTVQIREEVSRLRGEQEKRRSSGKQDETLPPAVFEKGLRDRNSPMCALIQHGYGGQTAKARKYTCLLPLAKIRALKNPEVSWLRTEQESVGRQGCKMPHLHTRYGRQRPRCAQEWPYPRSCPSCHNTSQSRHRQNGKS
jgi:hypothetical protein